MLTTLRKKWAFLIVFASFLCFIVPCYASIGPGAEEAQPPSILFVAEEDSPIAVENLSITFDYTGKTGLPIYLNGQIVSTYTLANTSAEEQEARLVLPVCDSPYGIHNELAVSVRGESVPFDVYLADPLLQYNVLGRDDAGSVTYDYAHIAERVKKSPAYTPVHYSPDGMGTMYTVMDEIQCERMNLCIDVRYDPARTQIIGGYGFNGGDYYEDGHVMMMASREDQSEWVSHMPVPLAYFYAYGDAPEVNVYGTVYNFDEDVDSPLYETRTDAFSYETETEGMTMAEFLETSRFLEQDYDRAWDEAMDNPQTDAVPWNAEDDWIYMQVLDEMFSPLGELPYASFRTGGRDTAYDDFVWDVPGFASYDTIERNVSCERISAAAFSVTFPPHSRQTVVVSQEAPVSMQRYQNLNNMQPDFTQQIIFRVPNHWQSFGGLDLRVIPGPNAPYVIASSAELARGDAGEYTFSANSMPRDDLEFVMHAHPTSVKKGPFLTVLFVSIAAVIAVIVLVVLKIRKKRAKHSAQA